MASGVTVGVGSYMSAGACGLLAFGLGLSCHRSVWLLVCYGMSLGHFYVAWPLTSSHSDGPLSIGNTRLQCHCPVALRR